MPKNNEFARVTMPAFGLLVTNDILDNATISLGILEQGIPCGVICAKFTDYRYEITWIYVDENSRKKGYAKALLAKLTSILREADEVYPLIASFTSEDEALVALFQKTEHFYVRPVGVIVEISPKVRLKSKAYTSLLSLELAGVRSYYDYPVEAKDTFLKKYRNQFPQLAQYLEDDLDKYDEKLSLAYGRKTIKAAVFAKELEGEKIEICYLYAEDVIALGLLLSALSKTIEGSFSKHTIRIVCVTDNAISFVEELFEEANREYLLEAAWDMRLSGEYPEFNQ